jgi:hypothetical protein
MLSELMFGVLRQIVRNRVPVSLRAYEDVRAGSDRRTVNQCPQRDVHVLRIAHEGVKQGTAACTVRVMRQIFAIDQQTVGAVGNPQLAPFDPSEWLERRAGRPTAIGAVTIQRIPELILNFILDRAAHTLAA